MSVSRPVSCASSWAFSLPFVLSYSDVLAFGLSYNLILKIIIP